MDGPVATMKMAHLAPGGNSAVWEVLTDPEPKRACVGATASWTAAALRRFGGVKSASRRRAEAALWHAAKAGGLAQSKTWRHVQRFMENLATPNRNTVTSEQPIPVAALSEKRGMPINLPCSLPIMNLSVARRRPGRWDGWKGCLEPFLLYLERTARWGGNAGA
jgi:hypothetical protein